ncbi:MAG: hypothetical protein DHS80DRAFT_33801 [Piptocephalis tieghemiana]|nr:MAG: hypothetical protein DHS80DRAFT_33801 [Piptocephalis tieghemiana]
MVLATLCYCLIGVWTLLVAGSVGILWYYWRHPIIQFRYPWVVLTSTLIMYFLVLLLLIREALRQSVIIPCFVELWIFSLLLWPVAILQMARPALVDCKHYLSQMQYLSLPSFDALNGEPFSLNNMALLSSKKAASIPPPSAQTPRLESSSPPLQPSIDSQHTPSTSSIDPSIASQSIPSDSSTDPSPSSSLAKEAKEALEGYFTWRQRMSRPYLLKGFAILMAYLLLTTTASTLGFSLALPERYGGKSECYIIDAPYWALWFSFIGLTILAAYLERDFVFGEDEYRTQRERILFTCICGPWVLILFILMFLRMGNVAAIDQLNHHVPPSIWILVYAALSVIVSVCHIAYVAYSWDRQFLDVDEESLDMVFSNGPALKRFRKFAVREFSLENVIFYEVWLRLQRLTAHPKSTRHLSLSPSYKAHWGTQVGFGILSSQEHQSSTTPSPHVVSKDRAGGEHDQRVGLELQRMYHLFIRPDAPYELNIPSETRMRIQAQFEAVSSVHLIPEGVFDQAKADVTMLLLSNTYPRFLLHEGADLGGPISAFSPATLTPSLPAPPHPTGWTLSRSTTDVPLTSWHGDGARSLDEDSILPMDDAGRNSDSMILGSISSHPSHP